MPQSQSSRSVVAVPLDGVGEGGKVTRYRSLLLSALPIPPQQVLTLVSNERVPLSDAMRMVFEINSLKNATPATVSRAGILFINETGELRCPGFTFPGS